jgi:hypothetical protein
MEANSNSCVCIFSGGNRIQIIPNRKVKLHLAVLVIEVAEC